MPNTRDKSETKRRAKTSLVRPEDQEDLAERFVILHKEATVAHSLEVATDTARKAKQIAATLVADLPE